MSALGLGLIAAVAWGFHDICVRSLSQRVPLMAALMAVLIVALGFQLALLAVGGMPAPLPATAVLLATVAGVTFLIASLGLYAAFQRGPVRLVAPVIASYPILSVGWAALSGETVTALQWLAVLAIVAGVGVVAALADDGTVALPAKGPTVGFAALACVGFAATFALGQHATTLGDPQSLTAITRIVALALLVAGMLWHGQPLWPGRGALPVLILMGLADGLALACVLSAGRLPDAQYAAVATSTFGLLTIIMAWIFLRERMTIWQWLGCAAAFAGIGYLAV